MGIPERYHLSGSPMDSLATVQLWKRSEVWSCPVEVESPDIPTVDVCEDGSSITVVKVLGFSCSGRGVLCR